MYNKVRRLASFAALALMLSVAMSFAQGIGNHGNPGVLPPNASAFGKTYGQWGDLWWQWAYSPPVSQSPLFDTTGALAANGQPSNHVFFLAGIFSTSGTAERTITIPAGTALFFPLLNTEWDNGVPPFLSVAELRAGAAASIDQVTELHASVDGVTLENLNAYRATSPEPFAYALPPSDNLAQYFGLDITGTVYPAVSDGYWIMLAPLPVGKHVLNFGGTTGPPVNFTLDITYHITVAPHRP